MPGIEYFYVDLDVDGKAIVRNVPNAAGTLLTYNPSTKEISTRSNTEIISDLGLNTNLPYVKKTGDTMSGALTLGPSTATTIRKDMSTNTVASGIARDMFQFVDAGGIKDVYGWKGSADATGGVILDYGYLGGANYNVKNAIRWNSAQQVRIGTTGVPTGLYALEVDSHTIVRGNFDYTGNLNTTTGEMVLQRQGVNRIRSNTNSLILSGETSIGIIYLRPGGDAVSTGQVMFNANNTTTYSDNYNLLFGSQISNGSAVFHTGNTTAGIGYGAWLAHNLQYNGTDFIQPRGTLRSLAFTSNFHKGFSFNIAEAGGTNGNVVSLTEVAKVSTTGTITTLNDGTSANWKSAYDSLPNLATLNTAQTFTASKTFSVMQKITAGVKYFEGQTANPYLRKYENILSYAPSGVVGITGNVKVTFPSNMGATMWSIKLTVVQYAQVGGGTNTKTVQVPMTININGYNSSSGGNVLNYGATGTAFHTNFVGVRIGIDSTNNTKIVWLDFNADLYYPKVIIDEVIVSHSGATSAVLDGAWAITITTDETNYTNQTTILKEDFKELSDLGTFFRLFGNSAPKHNTSAADVFTFRNASFWALGGANRPLNLNAPVVNFTPFNTGGSTYGFSLAARSNRMFFVTEENSVFGPSWMEVYHSGNFNPLNFYTKAEANGLFVGLTGDQSIQGIKTFINSPIVPNATLNNQAINLAQLDNSINSVVADYIPLTMIGAPNGVASLGANGIVPSAQLPPTFERTLFEYTGNFGQRLTQAIADASDGDTINCLDVPFDVGASYVITAAINITKPLLIKLPIGIINYTGTSGNIFNINASNVRMFGSGRSSREDLRINTTHLVYVNGNGGYHFYARGQNVITISGMDLTGIRTTNFDAQQDSATKPLDGSGGIYIEKSNPGTTGSGNTISNIVIENLLIVGTKVHGIYLDTPILGSIKDVRISQGGGHGIFINGGTSLRIENCYISSTHKAGYALYGHSYTSLIACASEFGGMGYWLRGCFNINLISCGAESNGNRSANVPNTNVTTTDSSGNTVVISDVGNDNVALFRGSSYVITGGQGIVLMNCASTNAGRPTGSGATVNSRDILVRGNARAVTIITPRTSVTSGNTYSGRFNISFEAFNGELPKGTLIYNPTTDGSVTPGVTGQYISSINNAANQAPVFIEPGAAVMVSSENQIFTPITTNLITSAEGLMGNAKTATTLQTPRVISVSGAVSGSGTFDGSANLNISTSLNVPDASSSVKGVVKLGSDAIVSGASSPSAEITGRIYPIQFNSSGQMVTIVPWTNTTYTLPAASQSVLGGVRLYSNTPQTIPPEDVYAVAKRTYGVQINSSGQAVVNVPWVDTNTTYSAGTGISMVGSAFSVIYGTTAGTAAQGNDQRILNGQIAFGYGDHSQAGYAYQSQLASYMPNTHPANSITTTNIDNWNAAYSASHTHSNINFLDNIDQYLGIGRSPQFSTVRLMNTLNYGNIVFGEDNIGGEHGLVDLTNDMTIAARVTTYLKYGSSVNGFQGLNLNISTKNVGIGLAPTSEKLEISGRMKASGGFVHGAYNSADMLLTSNGSAVSKDSISKPSAQITVETTGTDQNIIPKGQLTVVNLVDSASPIANTRLVLPLSAETGQQIICFNSSTQMAAVFQSGNPGGLIGLSSGTMNTFTFVRDDPGAYQGGSGTGKWKTLALTQNIFTL